MTREWVVEADSRILEKSQFNQDGLIPCIAQDSTTHEVLMMAWMDAEALQRTLREGRVTYFSRTRQEYWRKGDTSGNTQVATRIRLDCDGDAVLMDVVQVGPACHTGSSSCFDENLTDV
jgi:phosphoribosyl-AMP cyclohydrolase